MAIIPSRSHTTRPAGSSSWKRQCRPVADRSSAGTGGKGSARRDAYIAAGVSVSAGDKAVELMRADVESTFRPEVVGGLGGFGGAIGIPTGYRDPVLIASTDGVG